MEGEGSRGHTKELKIAAQCSFQSLPQPYFSSSSLGFIAKHANLSARQAGPCPKPSPLYSFACLPVCVSLQASAPARCPLPLWQGFLLPFHTHLWDQLARQERRKQMLLSWESNIHMFKVRWQSVFSSRSQSSVWKTDGVADTDVRMEPRPGGEAAQQQLAVFLLLAPQWSSAH